MLRSKIMRSLALENIAVQSDSFKKDLIDIFTRIERLEEKDIEGSDELQELKKITQDRLNINILFDTGKPYGPAVIIPTIDKNNVLINDWRRQFLTNHDSKDLLSGKDSDGSATGSANSVSGRLEGVFSKLSNTMYYPASFLKSSTFTAAEKAAVFMHELGHIFYYFLFLSHMVTTNRTISHISERLANTKSYLERETILVEARSSGKLSKNLDVEKVAKITDSKARELVIVDSVVRRSVSELGTNFYDLSTFEMLADEYASKFGFGRELVTALDKIYRSSICISYRSWTKYIVVEILKFVLSFLSPAFAAILVIIDGKGDGTYDKPGARLKRIRNHLVDQLKDLKSVKKESDRILSDIKIIDNILADIEDRRQTFDILWDMVIPSSRKELDIDRLQKQLEDLAYNDLFIKTQELKALS